MYLSDGLDPGESLAVVVDPELVDPVHVGDLELRPDPTSGVGHRGSDKRVDPHKLNLNSSKLI